MLDEHDVRPPREERRKWTPSPWHKEYKIPWRRGEGRQTKPEDKDATLNIRKVHKAAQIIENEYEARETAHIVTLLLLFVFWLGNCEETGDALYLLNAGIAIQLLVLVALIVVHQVVYFVVRAVKDLSHFD